MTPESKLFVSRADADKALAAQISCALEDAGYGVTLQQWDFANANFLSEMHDAIASGARVIALLSPEYLASKYCRAEWLNALAGDPLNENRRLIVLRVAECQPVGLLAGIAYWDLVPIRDDPRLVADVVRQAVREGRRGGEDPVAGPYWRAPRTVVDADAIRDTPSFTGRETELAALAAMAGCEIMVICGLGGMGKSTLAREYARRNLARYSVVWHLSADSEDHVIEGLLRLGAHIVPGLDQAQDRRKAALQVRTTILAGLQTPALVIFDNLEDERLLAEWHPRGAKVLGTSRSAAWGGDVEVLRLETLTPDEAIRYLRRESRRDDVTQADAGALADALGYLPLALAHAAAYLKRARNITAARYLARINDHLAQVPKGAQYDHAVFATFRESILNAERDRPGAAAVLCLAAFFAPDGIPEEFFKLDLKNYEDVSPRVENGAVSAIGLRSVIADSILLEEAIGELDRLSLIQFSTETRTFTMHRLVQAAARNLCSSAESGWRKSAVSAVNAIFPSAEFGTWPVCERILPHARAVIYPLSETDATLEAGRLANQCGNYLRVRASYAESAAFLRRALAFFVAVRGPDDPLVATAKINLAATLTDMNERSEAEQLFRSAIEIDERHYGKEHPEVAHDATNFASFLQTEGRCDEAETILRRSLSALEQRFGPKSVKLIGTLNNLGTVLLELDRLPEAEVMARRALEIARHELGGNHPRTAIMMNNWASLLVRLNRYAEAEETLKEALSIDEANYGPNHPHIAVRLRNLGDMHQGSQRSEEAEQCFRRALAIDQAVYPEGDPRIATDLVYLVRLLESDGRFADAEPFRRRLEGFRTGDP